MLQQVTHIEGLDGAFDHVDMLDDTNPGAIQVTFEARAEEMPFKSAEKGRIVRENFMWITKTYDLGRSQVSRRVRDKVKFDKETGKWKITELLKGRRNDGSPISDIARYPDAWNAFMRGTQAEVIGTPIAVLFKSDPSRAEIYKSNSIRSVEQLANLTDSELQTLGMGAGDDKQRALRYLKRVAETAPGIELTHQLEERDKVIQNQQNQIAELAAKLNELLEASLKRGGSKNQAKEVPAQATEAIVLPVALEGLEEA